MPGQRDANGRFIKGSGSRGVGAKAGGGVVRDIDKGYGALMKRLEARAAELTVGIHEAEGSEAKKVKSGAADGATLLDIAEIHELGLGVPRRSFIADWKDENEERHNAQLRAMAKAVADGTVASIEQGLERLGNLYVGEVQARMASGIDPPLAPATVRKKESSTPLIDTGQLRSSVTYRVTKR